MDRNLVVGNLAPNFQLTDQYGYVHDLEATRQKGPVVLVFYPYDQSPTCTRRLCSINVVWDRYADAGIQVFGVNNAEQESHAVFADKQALNMPLLTDTDFRVSRNYDALFEIGPIKVIRSTTVAIGSDGRIIFHKHGELPEQKAFIKFVHARNLTKTL